MLNGQAYLLILAVVGVGILHTMVPDHWAPIALLARQRGWSKAETARVALQAGLGHVATTLLFGVAVWFIGAGAEQRVGRYVDGVASLALVAFGIWIAVGAWREVRGNQPRHSHDHPHDHGHVHSHEWENDPLYSPSRGVAIASRHVHVHRHGTGGTEHSHWHDHSATSAHAITADATLLPPVHEHRHRTTGRMALLIVLGSSPMVEGIPPFFAASRYGFGLIVVMSMIFAISTVATYVVLSVCSASSLQGVNLGPVERYGEVISGLFIAFIGLAFGLWSLA